jgi:hypothetical protein
MLEFNRADKRIYYSMIYDLVYLYSSSLSLLFFISGSLLLTIIISEHCYKKEYILILFLLFHFRVCSVFPMCNRFSDHRQYRGHMTTWSSWFSLCRILGRLLWVTQLDKIPKQQLSFENLTKRIETWHKNTFKLIGGACLLLHKIRKPKRTCTFPI